MNKLFLENINKSWFWDVDINKLDENKSKRLIIERTITLGNLNDLKTLFRHYGKKEIIETVRNLNYLDVKTLHFISLLFDVPITAFKCYTRKQSIQTHWNF